jgi:rfaE bifunctional protein nucleotidyltransferase chain/domain
MTALPRLEEKIFLLEPLQKQVKEWQAAGLSVVFTNGCFDLLHVGHVTLIDDARRAGDKLILAINSDASVSALKGPSRPVVDQHSRAKVLAGLAAVDAVVVFDEPTPLELMVALKPDVIVKGGDYIADEIIGAKEVHSWGGRVKIVPFVEGFSTTKLIAKASVPEKH